MFRCLNTRELYCKRLLSIRTRQKNTLRHVNKQSFFLIYRFLSSEKISRASEIAAIADALEINEADTEFDYSITDHLKDTGVFTLLCRSTPAVSHISILQLPHFGQTPKQRGFSVIQCQKKLMRQLPGRIL